MRFSKNRKVSVNVIHTSVLQNMLTPLILVLIIIIIICFLFNNYSQQNNLRNNY